MSKPCPCGSQRLFSECCDPYLRQKQLPPTAEALMRSRYSAFSTGNVDYILATQQMPSRLANSPAIERVHLQKSVNSTQWLHLIVVSTQKGQAKDKTGVVEFVAVYRPKLLLEMGTDTQARSLQQMHERSRFIKQADQWLYTEGDRLPAYRPKRADPCWCGSGKPFKQCHS